MYARAANLFKMAKKWSSAGDTFVTLAQHHTKLGNKHDAATNYVDAANCYKKSDANGKTEEQLTSVTLVRAYSLFSTEAANCLIKAVDIYTDMGRFTIAAKHHQTIAEIYESDLNDLDKAMQHYEQAADYFKAKHIKLT
jgi:alpha-soluble NSF attachment protein